MEFNHRAFYSGDVLLSHGLSPYYHRGCSVSLPCSEWERVGPLRYCHQSAEPHWHFAAVAATQARGRISGDYDWRVLQTRHSSHVTISKNCDSLISTYRRSFRLRTAGYNLRLRFVLRSFVSSDC